MLCSCAGTDFKYCKTVSFPSGFNPYGLRVKALYNDAKFAVYPASGKNLPTVGYKLVSNGSIVQDSSVVATKKITVYMSLPYLPSVFDYAIYSNQNLSK